MQTAAERREYPRYTLNSEAYAGAYPRIGEIVNISLGGVLYHYLDILAAREGDDKFVLYDDNGCCLEEIPFETVSDKLVANESSFSRFATRQCRVKFGPLSDKQKLALEMFIARHCN